MPYTKPAVQSPPHKQLFSSRPDHRYHSPTALSGQKPLKRTSLGTCLGRYTPRSTDTCSFLPHPMRGADHLPTQQVRWWFLGMAFLFKHVPRRRDIFEGKK